MPATRLFVRILAANAFVLLTVPSLRAQVTNVDSTINIAVGPSPGSGHDYIKMLNETVNPVNGSVSLRVEAPVPKQRGDVNFPYYIFGYDSGGVSLPQATVYWPAGSLQISWTDSSLLPNNSTITGLLPGGFVANAGVGKTISQYNALFTQVNPYVTATCNYDYPYLIFDSFGVRHTMNLMWVSQNGGGSGSDEGCSYYRIPAGGYASDADLNYQASLLPSSGTSVVSDARGRRNKMGTIGFEDTNGNCCGATAQTAVTNNQITSITVPGMANPYVLTYGTATRNYTPGSILVTATSSSGCPNSLGTDNRTKAVLQTITLPNGKQYTFGYDPIYGLLNRITYPTGAWVSYTWSVNANSESLGLGPSSMHCEWQHDWPALQKRIVSFDGVTQALEQDFSYTTTWSNNGAGDQWLQKTTTVTTKDLLRTGQPSFQTVYIYSGLQILDFLSSLFQGQTPIENTTTYKDWNGSVLKTVTKNWSPSAKLPLLLSQCVTLDNNLTAGTFYSYGSLSVLTDKKEYDYGTIASNACAQGASPPTATPTRETAIAYQSFPNTPIYPTGPSILDRPSSVKVYANGTNGTLLAESDYTYDQPPVTAVTPAALGHDETNFSASYTNRGNPTTKTVKCLQAGSCVDAVTKYSYDETGQVLTMIDPCGNATCTDMTGTNHTTQYFYNDSYTILSNGQNVAYTPSGNTNAYLTKIIDPLGHTENFTYDFNNGQLTVSKDQNSQSTTYIYNDSFARPTQTNSPDGGQATVSYSDNPPSPSVTTSRKINSAQTLTTVAITDGLGHVVQTKLCEDGPACAQPVITDTAYDGLGRVRTQSNPHRTGSAPTDGTSTFYYDALGRTCLVVPPDGTIPTGNVCPATSPANDVFTTYSGNTTTVTDQVGKSRKSVSDGLGRLSQVFEDPGSTPHLNYETDYTYDTLDNLLTVNQKGNDASSANWRTRSFAYNSLSRLTSSTNPESNTQPVTPFAIVPTAYVYDANGNLSTKTAPAPNQTGTATVTTTYTYDVLNRVTQKSFSDTTPVVKYGYDGIAPSGCTLPVLPIGNGIGKRTGMCDAAGAEAWSYDITAGVGWKLTDARTTNSVTKSSIVQNNLAGSAATLTYPSGRIITYAFDAAARPLSAIDSTGPINYATAAAYAPTGALSSLTNGASLVSTLYYNNRIQPCRVSVKNTGTAPATCVDAATGNVLDFTYNFSVGTADNGNVTAITNNRDTTRSQSFAYDSLNRISTAKTTSTSGTTCWDEAFGYDPWGNLLTIGRITGYSCSNEELLNTLATPQNRISGDTYDTAGNLTIIPAIATYTYNAENQLTTTAGVNYTYDGDGKRVEKSSGKLYWYGMSSDPLDETDLTGSITNSTFNEYIFFGGKRIARRDYSNNVNYYFADHLGTARIVANSSGTILDDSDFYPFGGERVSLNSSPQNYKFAGKERDSESGLDNFGARYDSSSLGRFMSPDPLGGRMIDPQTLNKYSYTRNNPINLIDPTGLYTCADQADCKSKQDIAFEKARQQDLKSKDPNVVRAADAYGDPTKDNGVGVQFGDPGKGKNGNTTSDVRVDPNDPSKVQASETVTIRPGQSSTDLAATVGHEGSHVADAQDFVSTLTTAGAGDQSKNLTKYATELKAYLVTQSILDALASPNEKRSFGDCGGPCILGPGVLPAQALQTINQLLANPKNGYGVTPDKPGPVMYPNLTTPK
jgi:RHS repeat-associated protein